MRPVRKIYRTTASHSFRPVQDPGGLAHIGIDFIVGRDLFPDSMERGKSTVSPTSGGNPG